MDSHVNIHGMIWNPLSPSGLTNARLKISKSVVTHAN